MTWTFLMAAMIGAVTAIAAVMAARVLGAGAGGEGAEPPAEDTVPLFLLRGQRVVDASGAGRRLIAACADGPGGGGSGGFGGDGTGAAWPDLSARLRDVFPDLPERISEPLTPDGLRCAAQDPGAGTLALRPAGQDSVRVVLEPGRGGASGACLPELLLTMQARFYGGLHEALALTPCPVWRTEPDGTILWQNAAHRRLAGAVGRPHPFDPAPAAEAARQVRRIELAEAPEGVPRWYEVASRRGRGGWVHYALAIDAVVRAELTQQTFVQTLAKTFSHLPTGLAIFDRTQALVLFNPALCDLTGVPAETLAARPELMSFFDLLRERQVMPEPRDYASWRSDLAQMAAAARDDRYSETWTLPSGLTYRVTGRPHPDGAFAFLFEDISDEVTLTRRFRSELELSQSVIDAFDDAVAVFTASGLLAFCNAGYRALWGTDPEAALGDHTIYDAMRHWQAACRPSPAWGEVRDSVVALGEGRAGWDAGVALADGTPLLCRVEPIHAGATLVRFVRLSGDALPARRAVSGG